MLGIYDIRLIGQKPFAFIKSSDRLIRRVEFNPIHNLIAVASEDCKTQVFRLNNSSVQTDSDLQSMYVFIIFKRKILNYNICFFHVDIRIQIMQIMYQV